MLKLGFIVLGSVFVALGFIGVLLPGLPTTPFLLLAAGCYVRGSDRLYNWLIEHRIFGNYIKTFRKYKAMTIRAKGFALLSTWTMISVSLIFFLEGTVLRVVVIAAGITGSFIILKIKTLKK
ncbi:MAG: YbaN family protein [Spirochaetia bacterium]